MPEAVFINGVFFCVCGKRKSFKEDIQEYCLDGSSESDEHELQTTITCDTCTRQYELKIEATTTIQVEVEGYEITDLSGEVYFDKENEVIPTTFFDDLTIGADTSTLNDGEYKMNGKIYQIENGKLTYVYSSKFDENQMNLFN